MLCPAVLDPFEGPNYRLAAVFHQGILCPLLCKLICILFSPRGTVVTVNDQPPTDNKTTSSVIEKTNKQVAQFVDVVKQRSQLLDCDNSVLSLGISNPDGTRQNSLSTSSTVAATSNHHNNEESISKKVD